MEAEEDKGYILVVDDNEMNRDMLARRLQRQDYVVEVAEDGERAIEMIEAHHYDLVLLDIMMPRMNGYQVLEIVKANANLRDIPIIMISAVDDLDSVVKCIEMGAEDYLFKPFNPVLLKARVGASLDKRRQRNHNVELSRNVRSAITSILDDVQTLQAEAINPEFDAVLQRIQSNAEQLASIINGSSEYDSERIG